MPSAARSSTSSAAARSSAGAVWSSAIGRSKKVSSSAWSAHRSGPTIRRGRLLERERHADVGGQLDGRLRPHRAVEVLVELRLRQPPDGLGVHPAHDRQAAPRGRGRGRAHRRARRRGPAPGDRARTRMRQSLARPTTASMRSIVSRPQLAPALDAARIGGARVVAGESDPAEPLAAASDGLVAAAPAATGLRNARGGAGARPRGRRPGRRAASSGAGRRAAAVDRGAARQHGGCGCELRGDATRCGVRLGQRRRRARRCRGRPAGRGGRPPGGEPRGRGCRPRARGERAGPARSGSTRPMR